MNKMKTLVAFATLMLCGGVWAAEGVISINMGKGFEAVSVDQVTLAGPVPVADWIVCNQNAGVYGSKTDSSSGVTVEWDIAVGRPKDRPGGSCVVETAVADTCKYFNGGLNRANRWEDTYSITVSNIPYPKYKVFLYFTYDNRDGDRNTPYPAVTVNNGTSCRVNNGSLEIGSDRWGTAPENNPGYTEPILWENAMLIDDLSGKSLSLTGTCKQGAIAAVQIVKVETKPVTAKLLVNLGTSTAVDGWLAHNQSSGGRIPGSNTLTQNGITFKVEKESGNAGNFSSTSDCRASVQDFEDGAYVDIFGKTHTSLMDEVSASLGGVKINSDVYKTGLINGGQPGHTGTIGGLDTSKTYVVYVGMGYVKTNNNGRYHSFKIETSGCSEVGALDYVVTEPSTGTTKADHYQSFSPGAIIRPSHDGLMLVRLKGIKPTEAGTIVFTMPNETSGMNFLAVAEVKINKAKIGGTEYPTLAAALEAAETTATPEAPVTVTLLADVNENVTIPANVIVDTDNNAYTGTLNGSGKIIYRGKSPFYPLPMAPTLGNGWTGICSFTDYNNASSTGGTTFNPNDFANESGKIEFNGVKFSIPSATYNVSEIIITNKGEVPGLTVPNGTFTVAKKLSGTGTINADVTFAAGATIDVTGGAPSLAGGKELTFSAGDLNLVGVTDGATIIGNVTAKPYGLLMAVTKIAGVATGQLDYDADSHVVIYKANMTVEVTPDTTNQDNLDENGNFKWTSGAIWKKGDNVVELPEGARIVFDAATVPGVIIADQISAGEIIVRGVAGSSFVFHNSTGKVDGEHEIDDKIDCLTATSINLESFNGELGLRVPIKGPVVFGMQTTLKFIASKDEAEPSKAYGYSIEGRASAIQVALDTDAEAGWFVVPESMYSFKFAPANNAVTLVYEVNDGEETVTSPIYNAGNGSIKKTGEGTLNLTANMPSGAALVVQEGTLKYSSVESEGFKGSITVAKGATLINTKLQDLWRFSQTGISLKIYGTFDLDYTRLNVNNNQSWDIYGGATIKGFYQAGSVGNKSFDFADGNGLVINFHADPTDEDDTITWNAISRFRENDVTFNVEDGVTVVVKAEQANLNGARTLTKTGAGILKFEDGGSIDNHVAVSEGLLDLSELTDGNAAMKQTLKVGSSGAIKVPASMTKTIELVDPETTVLVATSNPDGSTTYTAGQIVAKIVDGETTANFASVEDAFAAATAEQVVTLCANIPGDLTVPENKKANAGSYTIGGAIEIGANATLTVSGDRTTNGIAGPGTFIVTSGTITAMNKSRGYAVDGATVRIDGGTFMVKWGVDGGFSSYIGDGSINDATFVIGEDGMLYNDGAVNLNGTITFDTDTNKSVFRDNKGFHGAPAIVKSGSGTLTFLPFKGGGSDSNKFTSLTLNGGELKLESAVVVDERISGVAGSRVVYDEETRIYSLVAATPDAPITPEEGEIVIPDVPETGIAIEPGADVKVPTNADASKIEVVYNGVELSKVVEGEGGHPKYVEVSINEVTGAVELTTTDSAKPATTAIAMATPTVETQDKVQFTITNPIPGLFYAVSSCDEPNGDFTSAIGDQATSGDAKTVSIPMTFTDGKKVKYYKVSVKATK